MSELLRVLQIEDSECDAALIVRELEKTRYQVEWERVEDAAGMRAALAERAWDVIISDYYLPQFGAPAALDPCRPSGPGTCHAEARFQASDWVFGPLPTKSSHFWPQPDRKSVV